MILMAKSNAQKKRKKLVREGRRNPENGRSPFARLDLRTQKAKNKKDLVYRCKHKNRNPKHQENDSYFLFIGSSKQFDIFFDTWDLPLNQLIPVPLL